MPNNASPRQWRREKRERPGKATDSRDNHHRGEIDTRKGGRKERERANQGHGSEPEHNVPSTRDKTVEDN